MPADISYLVWSAVLAFVQAVVAVLGAVGVVGLPTLDGWAGRAAQAHRNMLESLVLFAILVRVAHATQRANAQTALGAAIFFWARAAYAVIYLAGIPWLRTGVWAVSIVGLAIILVQLL